MFYKRFVQKVKICWWHFILWAHITYLNFLVNFSHFTRTLDTDIFSVKQDHSMLMLSIFINKRDCHVYKILLRKIFVKMYSRFIKPLFYLFNYIDRQLFNYCWVFDNAYYWIILIENCCWNTAPHEPHTL